MMQSAVAFWSVWLCMALGCQNSDQNVTKYQIETSSMAPTWFGSHLTASCVACGQESIVVSEAYDPALPTRCFSCGAVSVCKNSPRPGETIEVTQNAANTPIRRFDIVTFDTLADAHDPSPNALKRVWALPGERIELLNGEAWIDGKRLQKTTRELAAVSIPVSRFPKDTNSHWWVVDDSSKEDARIETVAGSSYLNLASNQQLEFRYARPNRNPAKPELLPSGIVDDFPFNQNSIAPFHEVADVLLAIELDHPATSPWFVSLKSEGKRYKVRVVSNVRGESILKTLLGRNVWYLQFVMVGYLRQRNIKTGSGGSLT